jgi:tetratricopeptide (TPR) repeat protein
MTLPRLLAVSALALCWFGSASSEEPAAKLAGKMPQTGLLPAKPFPDNCVLRYRVSTSSPECQAYFDQGLGYFYSYVWMEAARSFETAAQHDPDCAMAWWGLSRALERWSKRDTAEKALKTAQDKSAQASHREQLLIKARVQEKGLDSKIAELDRKKAANKTLDELILLYDDDEEAWYYKAQLADSGTASVPFYKALLRINPLHPGANHELVHFYEGNKRPALGYPHAEKYIESSPGIPHAFHMQAHLAMRLGRYDKSTDRSARAIELERTYHKEQGVKPSDDFQFSHHLETLMLGLTHDGRFAQADKLKAECMGYNFRHWLLWFRLHIAERNWPEAQKVIDNFKKNDKQQAAYLSAILHLQQGNTQRAAADVDVLRHAMQTGKGNKQLESRFWETQGILLCQMGSPEQGLKLLAKTIERTKDDYSHHAWGNGAYYMEIWGVAALKSGQDETAEEAFLEALAHEPSCVRGALGLQVLCERQGRTEEARRYEGLARRCWQRADPGALEGELSYLRAMYPPPTEHAERLPPPHETATP